MNHSQYSACIDAGLEAFASQYDTDASVIEALRSLFMKQWRLPSSATGETAAPVVRAEGKTTRRKTGYNVFVSSKFNESKTNGDNREPQERMAEFSKEWKNLSKEEKAPYEEEAAASNKQSGAETTKSVTSGTTKKRGLSGYNLFYRESKDQIKAELEPNENLMKHVGAAWRALTTEEQLDWNTRAKELNESS